MKTIKNVWGKIDEVTDVDYFNDDMETVFVKSFMNSFIKGALITGILKIVIMFGRVVYKIAKK